LNYYKFFENDLVHLMYDIFFAILISRMDFLDMKI